MVKELSPDDLLNIRVAKALGLEVEHDYLEGRFAWVVYTDKLYKHGYMSSESAEQALLGNYSDWATNLSRAVALTFEDYAYGQADDHFAKFLCEQRGITARQLVETWLAWKEQVTTD